MHRTDDETVNFVITHTLSSSLSTNCKKNKKNKIKKRTRERKKKDNNLNWKINTNKDCHILSSFP